MRYIICALMLALAACAKSAPDAPQVVMKTSEGSITLELYPEKAPATVENFLRYVDEGAYNGSYIYRTTRADNDPMITIIQGGLWAPWRDGLDEDYEPQHPTVIHETTKLSGLSHTDGVISMARMEPGTASSEFFISIGDNTALDFGGARNPDGQGFAAFGRVVDGMDVVRAINTEPVAEGEGFAGQILAAPVESISVSRK